MSTTVQQSMGGANGISDADAPRKFPSLASLIRDAVGVVAEARRQREAVAILKGLDDRMLKDIGIGRSEIESLVYRGGVERIR